MSTTAGSSNNILNNTIRFKNDDKVFAKVRGYPPWPAKVRGLADETPNKIKYHVFFYGTEETAICKQEELYDYVQYRDKYGKPTKRKFFQEAIDSIERDLNPTARKPPSVKDTEKDKNVEKDKTMEKDKNAEKEKPIEKDSDEEDTLVIDETPNPKKGSSRGVKRKHTSAVTESAIGNESTPIAEVTSRSGRKIKPKKFSDDAETSPIESDRNVNISTTSKDGASEQKQDAEDSGSSDEDVNLLTSSKTTGNKLENGEVPKKSKRDYKTNLKKKVEEMRTQQTQPPLPEGESLELLKTEVQLLDSDCRIKSSLGLSRANCDECIRAMDEVLDLHLNALMLKKHPEVVDTVKKLRRYVGNLEKWKLTEEQEERFKEKAGVIRRKADHMYNKFKGMFTVPSGKSFIEVYNSEVSKFNSKISNLSVSEVYGMVKEPED